MELRSRPWLRDCGACPYLPERNCRYIVWPMTISVAQALRSGFETHVDPLDVEHMLERGFLRQGSEFWTPSCEGCQECIQMRIPIARFTPSKSQRRVWRRNQDLEVRMAPPDCTDETYALACRHRAKFKTTPPRDRFEKMCQGLGPSGLECRYYDGGRLVGLGLLDVTPNSVASLEFFHDVDSRRTLGVYSLLYELDWARRTGREYLYLGPWIRECSNMAYKTAFRPYELLLPGAGWQWREPEAYPGDGRRQ